MLVVIGIFVAVHIVRQMLPADDSTWLTLALAFIPARYSGYAPDLPGGELAGITSFITHMAVHGDFLHLLINSAWMLAFGSLLARRFGAVGFINFSLATGIVGALFFLAANIGLAVPVIGASGAVSGQMAGALRIFFGAARTGRLSEIRDDPNSVPIISIRDMLRDPRILAVIVLWVVINYLFGIGGGSLTGGAEIAWQAHLGGFISGILLVGFFDPVKRTQG